MQIRAPTANPIFIRIDLNDNSKDDDNIGSN